MQNVIDCFARITVVSLLMTAMVVFSW